MIKTFVKRPVRVHAVQWTGYNHKEIQEFTKNNCEWRGGYTDRTLVIHTLEGDHYASVGDWIIRGVKGEYYPCKPDTFERTYEEI